MVKKFFLFLLIFLFFSSNDCHSQTEENNISSILWSNNTLSIFTDNKISYAESRLKNPERLVVDILNCKLSGDITERNFISRLGENISITQSGEKSVRVVFLGDASINRKVYLTNNEKNLIVRLGRISEIEEENTRADIEDLKNFPPGELKEIEVEGSEDESIITIDATRTIKFTTYELKDPNRLAIDLLNITPPKTPLPRYEPTSLVSGIRVGRAANGYDSTRVVIDLTMENISFDVKPSITGNKIKIKFSSTKKKKSNNLSNIKVIIDPGHGGYDQGAYYGGFKEKDITLAISQKLKAELEKYGITVFLTRETDIFLSLAERVELTNAVRPNVFISIHANALKSSAIRGVETYYWNLQSQKLAYLVHKSILNKIKIPDHHIRTARFYVIKYTPVPAILAETAFLSNAEDRKLITNAEVQQKYAEAFSEAILKFLDIEAKPVEKEEEKKVEKTGNKN